MMRACAKCGRVIPAGRRYCDDHTRRENARRTEKVKRHGYKSAHWQQIRKQRLELAGYRCELRLPGCTGIASHVHLDERYEGQHRVAALEDTKAACPSCSGAVDAPRSHTSHG
jgi:hypothetical protein